MKCPNCRSDISQGIANCPYCGYTIGESSNFVKSENGYYNCGHNVGEAFNGPVNRGTMYPGYRGPDGATQISGNPMLQQRERYKKIQRSKTLNSDIKTLIYLLISLLAVNMVDTFLLIFMLMAL